MATPDASRVGSEARAPLQALATLLRGPIMTSQRAPSAAPGVQSDSHVAHRGPQAEEKCRGTSQASHSLAWEPRAPRRTVRPGGAPEAQDAA
jgi:hypothetical protein